MQKLFFTATLCVLLLCATRANAAPLVSSSLRFYGNGANDIDRVKIKLDAPARPIDVGGKFTIEWWMKANAGENTATVSCDANDGWIYGDIVIDRDVYGAGDNGDYGIALNEGRVAFGVSRGNEGNTICGNTDVTDGQWHHVAVTRHKKTGALKIFVDGVLDASGPGASGNVSYRDGRATDYPNSDPYLVIGAEKHDAGAPTNSYHGWMDELRISKGLRYKQNFTRPSQPFVTDDRTRGLYHFDEASGDTLNDSSNAVGGPSHGTRKFGGSPAGPVWSSDSPF